MIEQVSDLDVYFGSSHSNYGHIDAVFFCLGSEIGKGGEDLFIKVDKTYALLAADIAVKNGIFCWIQTSRTIITCRLEEGILIPAFCI